MKKLLAMLLTLSMLFTLTLSLGEEAAPAMLTEKEFDDFKNTLLQNSLESGAYRAEKTDEGYLLHFDEYTLLTDSDVLNEASNIKRMYIDKLELATLGLTDFRNIALNYELQTLLSAYPIENTALVGSTENAVLYMQGELPGTYNVGYVNREFQRISEVSHLLYFMSDNGVQTRSVRYTISQDAVVAISIYFTSDFMTLDNAKDEINAFTSIRENTEYISSVMDTGYENAMRFDRDDLLFSNIDYLDLTPNSIMSVLGDDFSEEWLLDGEFYIHTMQWHAATATFIHDQDKNLIQADSLHMDEGVLEGPRGIRIGDQQQLVTSRFFFDTDHVVESNLTYIYGEEEGDNYATAEYISAGETIFRYVTTVGEKTIALILNFTEATLTGITFQTY